MRRFVDVVPGPVAGTGEVPLDDNYIVYTVVLARLGTPEPLLALRPEELERALQLFEVQEGGPELLSTAVACSVSTVLGDTDGTEGRPVS
jgi:hypothetical protein